MLSLFYHISVRISWYLFFFEQIGGVLLSTAEHQVLVDLSHALLLLRLLVSLLCLLILLIHLLVLRVNALLEALIERLTPLDDGTHVLALTLERKVASQTLLGSHSHADVLELLLHHFLRL